MNISKIELTLKNGTAICLLTDGLWVVKSDDRIYPLSKEEGFWFAFPLLESSFPQARKILGDDFPYAQLLLTALHSKSDYWLNLALEWLSFIQPHDRELFKATLESIEIDKSYSQRHRHIAKKYLKGIDFKKN